MERPVGRWSYEKAFDNQTSIGICLIGNFELRSLHNQTNEKPGGIV